MKRSAPEGSATNKQSARLLCVTVASAALFMAACSELPQEPAIDDGKMLASFVAGAAFTDDFNAFDDSRWVRSSHWLGRGPLLPGNVEQGSGFVSLVTRSNGYTGAEIMSRDEYGTGTFTISARCRVPGGAVCAFFMYQIGVGDRADEIDIEIIPSTNRIWFTTWLRGRRTFHSSQVLPFNPATAYHTYAFQRATGEIRFLVDGVVMQKFVNRKKLPQAAMPVFANAWWPTWLTPAGDTGAWDIDYIRVE